MDRSLGTIPPDEARDIYLLAINYCIQRLNQGQRQYIRKGTEFYRGMERAVLLEGGILSKFTYSNILMLAIALEEMGMGSGFLEQYKENLPAKERKYLPLQPGIYYFQKPDYGKSSHGTAATGHFPGCALQPQCPPHVVAHLF